MCNFDPDQTTSAKRPRVGTVLVFSENYTQEIVQHFLDQLNQQGIIENQANAVEFDSLYAGPVWYIP